MAKTSRRRLRQLRRRRWYQQPSVLLTASAAVLVVVLLLGYGVWTVNGGVSIEEIVVTATRLTPTTGAIAEQQAAEVAAARTPGEAGAAPDTGPAADPVSGPM